MDRSSHHTRTANAGFTLVEVIVVLSVILLLSGIAIPLISGYVEDSKRARAEAEIKVLAGAVTSFYKDVGVYPARDSAATDNRLYVLLSGSAQPATNPYATNHTFSNWGRSATTGDVLDNHLLNNSPQGTAAAAYPTTGSYRWRGPYVSGGVSVDPWGRPYIVNVISAWNTNATNYKRVFVLSAGANGVIETVAQATATTNIGGDDIGLILHQRQ